MDGFTIVAFATTLFVFIAGAVFALCAIRMTHQQTRGRGAIVVLAFFIPAIYVTYLLAAGHFRNEYHRTHSNAYESEGYNNLKIGHGYVLWFFDETPWMASIGRGSENAQITNIQRLSIDGERITGQTGKTNMEDGPTDYFFFLNLATGALQKFKTQAELSLAAPGFKPLDRPEELYNVAINKEHNSLFWLVICLAPLGLAVSLFLVNPRRRGGATNAIADNRSTKLVP
jgi:hypothetical protein